MAYPPGTYFDSMTGLPIVPKEEPVTVSNLDMLCQNCGERAGEHYGTACDGTGYFQPVSPPQYKPYGWHPTKSLEDIAQSMSAGLAQSLDKALAKVLEQEKKDKLLLPAPAFKGGKWKPNKEKKKAGTKPWEEPKFNTSKEPKGEIKYYKPVPEPKEVEPVPEVDGVTVYKEADGSYYVQTLYPLQTLAYAKMFGGLDTESAPPKTATGAFMMSDWKQKQAELKSYMLSKGVKDPDSLISSPTTGMGKSLTKEDILNAVESIKAASIKPYDFGPVLSGDIYYQQYGRGIRQHGLDQLIEDFANRYGRGLNPFQFGKGLLEFAEKEGHRYGYTNREAERLGWENEKLKHLNRNQSTTIVESHDRIRELETQMAGMVQKATPKMPRNFECNGRKFKDA